MSEFLTSIDATLGHKPELKEDEANELSPEIFDTVMDKVIDIDKKGTAYSVIFFANEFKPPKNMFNEEIRMSSDELWEARKKTEQEDKLKLNSTLSKLFSEGLLGNNKGSSFGKEEINKNKWFKYVRNEPNSIYFNIVGRSKDGNILHKKESSTKPEILYSEYYQIVAARITRPPYKAACLLFKLDSFHETTPQIKGKGVKMGHHEFMVNESDGHDCEFWHEQFGDSLPGSKEVLEHPRFDEFVKLNKITEDGYPKVYTEYGFVAENRIAPRFFSGLMVYNTDPQSIESIVSTIKESLHGKESLLVPIYDVYGNLIWPKKMEREEIKKMMENNSK
ncbi:MAG: hypothetical protein M1338_03715 [Patescibacteria group bacterium]|nr:hypothetical protein [Patescibacteria group bacterium]